MIKSQSQTEKQTIREKDRWKLREPESEESGERDLERERNAESSRFRIIKSESHKNTKQRRRVPDRAKERKRREEGGRRKGSQT